MVVVAAFLGGRASMLPRLRRLEIEHEQWQRRREAQVEAFNEQAAALIREIQEKDRLIQSLNQDGEEAASAK